MCQNMLKSAYFRPFQKLSLVSVSDVSVPCPCHVSWISILLFTLLLCKHLLNSLSFFLQFHQLLVSINNPFIKCFHVVMYELVVVKLQAKMLILILSLNHKEVTLCSYQHILMRKKNVRYLRRKKKKVASSLKLSK